MCYWVLFWGQFECLITWVFLFYLTSLLPVSDGHMKASGEIISYILHIGRFYVQVSISMLKPVTPTDFQM